MGIAAAFLAARARVLKELALECVLRRPLDVPEPTQVTSVARSIEPYHRAQSAVALLHYETHCLTMEHNTYELHVRSFIGRDVCYMRANLTRHQVTTESSRQQSAKARLGPGPVGCVVEELRGDPRDRAGIAVVRSPSRPCHETLTMNARSSLCACRGSPSRWP